MRLRPSRLGRQMSAWLLGATMLALLLPGRALALDPARDLLQYNLQSWSRRNGLPVNAINDIAQTRDGYLWLGTSAGPLRFDGTEFKLLDLARLAGVRSSIVTSVAAAQAGGLWVGMENGAFGFYDGQAFSFRGKEEWGGTNMNVRTLFETTDGTLWLIGQREAARLTKSGSYEPVLTWTNILRGFKDSKGRVWIGTSEHGVHYWEAGKVTALADPDLISVVSIAEDREGQIWFGTDKGVVCYDANLRRKAIPPLALDVRILLVDRQGTLWIGTGGQGLVRYRNGRYTSLRKLDGLAGDYVNALTEDREGSLWIGTREGLSQLTDVKFPTHPVTADPLTGFALAVSPSSRGGVWVGSPNGLSYFDGRFTTYSVDAGLPAGTVKRVFEASNGDVYLVSERNTLVIFSGEKAAAIHQAPTLVVGLAEDEQGVIASLGGTLHRATKDRLTPYAFTGEAPDFQWILNLAPGRDGAIWVASEAGIFRVRHGTFQRWTTDQADFRVQGVCEDSDGIVWGALLSGIARLKDNQLRIITRKDGLFDDNIYAIVPDDHGNLWIDSGRGIFRVSRQSMNDFAEGKIARVECVSYEGLEAVKSADKTGAQERVGCKSLDGRIWFASANGVVEIDPARIPSNPIAPPVHVDRVLANGRESSRRELAEVPPGKGELEFHFTAPNFLAPQKTRFRYRLTGYDKDWVDAGDRRVAFYTNLAPGRYAFRVIAANGDGVWNETGDTLDLRLRPHFFQTGWYYSMWGGVGLATLAGIYRWRVRHLRQKQKAWQETRDLLEAEVRSRTAELATANSSLQQRTQALEAEVEERKRAQREIERMHRQLLEVSRQAGMAEVATGILHNVGNVLNSVNVSTTLVIDRVRRSKIDRLPKVGALFDQHAGDLGHFLTSDPRGQQVPRYLQVLARDLAAEQSETVEELQRLRDNLESIKAIVAMQQTYAHVAGVAETFPVTQLVDDALQMTDGALAQHEIKVTRDYQAQPTLTTERHKVLQVLVNVLQNASQACAEAGRTDRQIVVRITEHEGRVRIAVIDNGVGIAPENLALIFRHEFSTKKKSGGFGLHQGALVAKELGGALHAESAGPGQGATFVLELPLQRKAPAQ